MDFTASTYLGTLAYSGVHDASTQHGLAFHCIYEVIFEQRSKSTFTWCFGLFTTSRAHICAANNGFGNGPFRHTSLLPNPNVHTGQERHGWGARGSGPLRALVRDGQRPPRDTPSTWYVTRYGVYSALLLRVSTSRQPGLLYSSHGQGTSIFRKTHRADSCVVGPLNNITQY